MLAPTILPYDNPKYPWVVGSPVEFKFKCLEGYRLGGIVTKYYAAEWGRLKAFCGYAYDGVTFWPKWAKRLLDKWNGLLCAALWHDLILQIKREYPEVGLTFRDCNNVFAEACKAYLVGPIPPFVIRAWFNPIFNLFRK